MEKRRYPRVTAKYFCVDVSDGVGFFSGNVSDFSRAGLCMIDLPEKVNGEAKKMTVVVSGHRKNFKMNVKPRWSTKNNDAQSIGVQIVNIPTGWTDFVLGLEPLLPEELSGGY